MSNYNNTKQGTVQPTIFRKAYDSTLEALKEAGEAVGRIPRRAALAATIVATLYAAGGCANSDPQVRVTPVPEGFYIHVQDPDGLSYASIGDKKRSVLLRPYSGLSTIINSFGVKGASVSNENKELPTEISAGVTLKPADDSLNLGELAVEATDRYGHSTRIPLKPQK